MAKSKQNNTEKFLEQYVGTYRVLARYDETTEDFPRDEDDQIDNSFDDLYIPCSKGEIREAFVNGEQKLAWYTDSNQQGKNIFQELKSKYPKLNLIEDNCDRYDYYIYFDTADMEKVATIVNPRTNGAKIKPFSDKNLPKVPYTIPENDIKKFNTVIDKLDTTQKMQFVKKCCIEFDAVIQKTKGKKYDVALERKNSKLKSKNFIHSIGMWNEFVDFTKKYLKIWESEGDDK